MPMAPPLELCAFRYRDPRTGKRVRARYRPNGTKSQRVRNGKSSEYRQP